MDILQVLEGLAYVGFIAGAFFAVLELRSISRDRKLELSIRLGEQWDSHEFSEALVNLTKADFQSAETAKKTCPEADMVMVAEHFDYVAAMIKSKLVDEEFILESFDFVFPWTTMKPWCLDWRSRMSPTELASFEWMANRQQAMLRARTQQMKEQ